MPTLDDGQNNSKTACICLFCVRFPTCIGKPGREVGTVSVWTGFPIPFLLTVQLLLPTQ